MKRNLAGSDNIIGGVIIDKEVMRRSLYYWSQNNISYRIDLVAKIVCTMGPAFKKAL